MKEEIKIYIFYLFGRNVSFEEYPAIGMNRISWKDGIGTVLYAYTPRKDIAMMFKKMRDMRKFEMRVVYMTALEYERFDKKYSDHLLNDYSYTINTMNFNKNKYSKDCTYILSTQVENYEVHDNIIEHLINLLGTSDDKGFDYIMYLLVNGVFKKKYRKVLDDIFSMSILLSDILYPYEASQYPSYNIDEAAMYAHLFHNTFKEGRKIKCESLSFIRNRKMI